MGEKEEIKDTQIIDPIEKALEKFGSKLGDQVAELSESAKKILEGEVLTRAQLAEELDNRQKTSDKADMKAGGFLDAVNRVEVWDIPVGQAALGGFAAVFASELIDGFLMSQSDPVKGMIKLATAGVVIKWGSRVFGSTGSKAAGILLAYDGIRSLIPIDRWAKNVADAVSGAVPLGGLGGFKQNIEGTRVNSADYYAALKGGM
jgi:hypothetical protein